jgi:hypothetical protein
MRKIGPSGKHVLFEMISSLGIFVYHGTGEPSQADWDEFMRQVTNYKGDIRGLVFTEGWRPSRAQGQQIKKAAAGRELTVAIVSPLAAMAFTVSAFALINRRMRFFSPDELQKAFDYLNLNAEEASAVREILGRAKTL